MDNKHGTQIGKGAIAEENGTAIGYHAYAEKNAVAMGTSARASKNTVVIKGPVNIRAYRSNNRTLSEKHKATTIQFQDD